MTNTEILNKLIKILINEYSNYKHLKNDKKTEEELFTIFRSFINIREAKPISKEFIDLQDEYLKRVKERKGILDLDSLIKVKNNIYLYYEDITRLKVDAIVNAANEYMTGCYIPCHNCIDNIIHTYSGIQLRQECSKIINNRGKNLETGKAIITKAYNLPSKYIIHTVGPIVKSYPTKEDCALLKDCYLSCLNIAKEYNLESIAFCCISTGVYNFDKEIAAKIALNTCIEYLKNSNIKIIFSVYDKENQEIYRKLIKQL